MAGSVIAIIGAVLAISGGAIFALFGSDGAAASGPQPLTSPTTALVSDVASIQDTAGITEVLGETRVRIKAEAQTTHGTFVGIGRKADVDRYLAGAPIDKVSDLDVDPFRLTRDTRPGSATPAPPAGQSFWVAKSGGSYADLDWKISDGNYRLVVMNTDGSRNVSTDADFEITVPNLPEIGIGILAAGLLVLGGGVVLIAVGARRRES